jgi:hypothetical protein
MSWIQQQLMNLIFAAVPIGTIAFIVMAQAKQLSVKVAELPAWVKRSVVGIISVVLTAIFAWAKVPVVCEEGIDCLTKLDADTVTALLDAGLGAIVAMVIHAKKK